MPAEIRIPVNNQDNVKPHSLSPRCLLIGPHDPKCGEYTFLAPPLGVWRLAGHLQRQGVDTRVFDPNCGHDRASDRLEQLLAEFRPDVVGISTTGMTLNYDLAHAHQVRKQLPGALLVAGGMEATFNAKLLLELAPFELVVLGEGERPLAEIVARRCSGRNLYGIPGTALLGPNGELQKHNAPALDGKALTESILGIPYEQMPYETYWHKLEHAYRVGELPHKAAREARLAEIRSVRLITLNYCPMGCSFCSSTNFLHEAEGRTAKIARLSVEHCIAGIDRILETHPDTRTIIFQDDIFVFTNDDRILPLCEAIVERKRTGRWSAQLSFISTNRIDAMTPERAAHMRAAGFRVLGFGIESFSLNILREFNKRLIYKHIGPNLRMTLKAGITPFLDLIMSSPRCSADDVATNVRHANFWLGQGCEIGMYPFVIPFSGAAMSNDRSLDSATQWETKAIPDTAIRWQQPTRILPVDPEAADLMLAIEEDALTELDALERQVTHLPSRIRSLVWIGAASRHLVAEGYEMPDAECTRRAIDDYVWPMGQEALSELAN